VAQETGAQSRRPAQQVPPGQSKIRHSFAP
jgi:hypothetical protein